MHDIHEAVAEKSALPPQVQELLTGFMQEAVSSGLDDRYTTWLLRGGFYSREDREQAEATSRPNVRAVLDAIRQEQLAATNPPFVFAVKRDVLPVPGDGDEVEQLNSLQLYKVDPSTGEAIRHSCRGVFADGEKTDLRGRILFGHFTEHDADLVSALYDAQESLGWELEVTQQ